MTSWGRGYGYVVSITIHIPLYFQYVTLVHLLVEFDQGTDFGFVEVLQPIRIHTTLLIQGLIQLDVGKGRHLDVPVGSRVQSALHPDGQWHREMDSVLRLTPEPFVTARILLVPFVLVVQLIPEAEGEELERSHPSLFEMLHSPYCEDVFRTWLFALWVSRLAFLEAVLPRRWGRG